MSACSGLRQTTMNTPPAPLPRMTVLLVDDSPGNLVLLSGLLNGLYRVKLAADGDKALEIVRGAQPPDLILLDVMMPGLSGFDVCRALKADPATRDIPVIFLTALGSVEDEQRGLALGAVDYIAKPVNPPVVLARVRTHLENKAAADLLRAQAREQRRRAEQIGRQASELSQQLRLSESGVRRLREQLELAAEATGMGTWVHDLERDRVAGCDRWAGLFGVPAGTVLSGAELRSRIHPEDQGLLARALQAAADGGSFELECRVLRADGTPRWIASHGQLGAGEVDGARSLRGVSLNVTERKLAALELEQRQREMMRLSRAVTLGELSGALAHELNQPLMAILSNAQAALRFLDREPLDRQELREILDDIVGEDRRAGEVIRRLRQLLSAGETKRQPVDLNELIADTLHLLRSDLLVNRVTAALELDAELPSASLDRVQLQQVLINLVVNACDAMRDAPPAHRLLRIRTGFGDDGRVAKVSVIDHGCGLPPEGRDRVFESFYTTKVDGMGLGLSVCRTIVAAHGGRLWSEDNPDAGASFHFTLPLGAQAPR